MKQVILFSLLSFGILPASKQSNSVAGTTTASDLVSFSVKDDEALNLFSQPSPENEKMLAVIFKAQDFCRAELKDFEFDIHYSVVSATVYFSGPGFKNVETGFINSNSLQPIRKLMDRCIPGSMVVFDNVKVVGPDKLIRTIAGSSYLLH
jgi:hypothetical protein